ncbi:MAG: hypothetical protein LBH30_07060, partial [Prevotellaceae bacterium]|nr:hypothetical protein [Prevotellaceae bacterium]
ECRISGNGIYGNHREHGAFTQDIVEELVVGQYSFFTGGSMTLIVPVFGGFASPIDIIFAPNAITVTYNGEVITY